MNKTVTPLAALIALALTACGGGSTPETSPAPAPSKLAGYVGTWTSACTGQAIHTVAIADTAGVKDSVTHTFKMEVFAQAGCMGAVIATQTYASALTETYTGAADVGVIFVEGSPSVPARADLVLREAPAGYAIASWTGPNVVQRTEDGILVTCVDFKDGSETCYRYMNVDPGPIKVGAGLYRNGNKMAYLRASGNVYIASMEYTKK